MSATAAYPPYATTGSSMKARKAVVALNNAAVSLLAKGCLSEALVTFDDAVRVMDIAALQAVPEAVAATTDCPLDEGLANEVRLALDRRNKRAAKCSTKFSTTPPPSVPSCNERGLSHGCPTLQVISSHCNPARIYEVLTSCTNTASLHVAFPVTIDLFEAEEQEETTSKASEVRVMFETAVVLHNYGIACDSVAMSMERARRRPTQLLVASSLSDQDACVRTAMQVKAFDLFQRSSAILAQIDLESHDTPLSPSLTSQRLLAHTVVTHNLINASIELFRDYEYREYCVIMQSLLHMVGAQHWKLPFNDHYFAAKA